MRTKPAILLNLFLILVAFGTSAFLYPQLPESMASHWNAEGDVNGYMPKLWGAFLMPMVGIFLLALFLIIPNIDPLKKNLESFRPHYNTLMIVMTLFLLYMHLLSLWWNLGHTFDLPAMMLPAVGLLFIYLGILLGKSKRNWFVGIRTPWTLSSDIVWDKTNKLGKYLFYLAGYSTIAGIFFREYAFPLMFGSVLVAAIVPLVYSYIVFRQENNPK